jgi:hypothetical protein
MLTREDDGEVALWIVASPRMSSLAPVLAALGSAGGARELGRVADLASANARGATVIVDADALHADDWLDLRRFLESSEAARIVLLGDDASRREVRALLRREHARWMSWPPDLEDLRALVASAAGAGAPLARSAPAAATPSRSPAGDVPSRPAGDAGSKDAPRDVRPRDPRAGELEEIERILGASHAPDAVPPPADPKIAEAVELDEPLPRESAPAVSIRIAEAGDAFRHQVADLADIAQRIEIGLQQVRDAQSEDDAAPRATDALDRASRDVARLGQFARTLGYLVAPPGPGGQTFDLAELLELFLSEIRTSGPDAPRCLLRSNGALAVRSDRQLLTQAFDALFGLARSSAGRGEIVRVQARRDDEAGDARALVSIDFPSGRLSQLSPEEIVSPYALRAVYPEIGANALSAAVRIFEGQGGRCALAPQLRGRMEWRVSLPLASDAGA